MRVGSITILALICAFALIGCNRPIPAPKAQTVSKLKNVYYTMRLLQEENGHGIVEQLQAVTNKATLQDRWMELMIRAAIHSGIDSDTAAEQFCRDGYGRLFNVELRTNLIVRGASGTLTNTDFPVIVWSSGSNAVNELGFGDDVALPNDGRPGDTHTANQGTKQ